MSGFVPPTAGVFDAPAVSISLNEEWRSYVIGVLESLLSSPVYGLGFNGVYDRHAAPVWSGDDDTVYAADQEIEKLMSALVKGNAMLPGMVMAWAGEIAPAGWLLCDGSQHLKVDYPFLWGVLSTHGLVYNDDDENFVTPDLRGRVVVGAGEGVTLTDRPFGEYAGEEQHTLTIGELAGHDHVLENFPTSSTLNYQSGASSKNVTGSPYVDRNTTITGTEDGAPHNNMPPYHALNFIIKT